LDAYGRLAVDVGHLRERVKALEGDVGDLEDRFTP
jgi:hypothetical protein